MKLTIRKIAEIAGVSRGTVDRVINNRSGVKPEVREKVLEVMSNNNYVPNMAAKALAYSKRPISIGVIMPPKNILFFNEVRSGIDFALSEMKDLGISAEFRFVSNRLPLETSTAIDELVALGVSGLMLTSMDDEKVRTKINKVSETNIPVVTFNSDVSLCKRICFVGQDLYKSGQIAAGLMLKLVKPASKLIAVTGCMDFQAHSARIKGFTDTLKKLQASVEVAEIIEGYDRYDDTYNKLMSKLKDPPDISGIYMATGDVRAAVEVLKELKLCNKLRMICNDTLPEIVENLEKGIIDFTIVQNPFQQGYLPVKILYDYIFSNKLPAEEYIFTETGIKIFQSL